MLASSGPLLGKKSVWADLTSICFESTYKLASLDQPELSTLLKVDLTLYPKETEASLKVSVLYKKYKSLTIGGERYGSTAGSRLFPYARIIASWCDNHELLTLE